MTQCIRCYLPSTIVLSLVICAYFRPGLYVVVPMATCCNPLNPLTLAFEMEEKSMDLTYANRLAIIAILL
jgi:hypothetical protein